MSKVYTLYKSDNKFTKLNDTLAHHMIKLLPLDIEFNYSDLYGSSLPRNLFRKVTKHLIENNVDGHVLLFDEENLYVISSQNTKSIEIRESLSKSISKYIIKNHWYTEKDLSCRPEATKLLPQYVKDDSPNFRETPERWIRGNTFFDILRPRPFYDRLLAFNLDKRGAFLKVWNLRAQHNYFHPSVNSGLPVTKKKDAIHEGTFLMHDMFHFIFFDPIITGHETVEEQVVFIACRMMSEACTLVLADMIAVAHSGIEHLGYDIRKRQIYPLFKSLNLDPFDIETVRKVLYANCVYCLYGDTSVYKKMNADSNELEFYTSKYFKFFSGDFAWNEKNIKRMVDKFQKNEGLKKYFSILDEDFKKFNTYDLANRIRKENRKLSFNKLFEVFWSQLEELIRYNNKPNPLIYSKTCYIKYLSGQIYLACKYYYREDAQQLIRQYSKIVKKIKNSINVEEVNNLGENFIKKFNRFIEHLGKEGFLLPHEVIVEKLHVTHFPPEYVNYDINDSNFEQLEAISKRILGKFFERESFRYRPISQSLKNYYLKIVSS